MDIFYGKTMDIIALENLPLELFEKNIIVMLDNYEIF